MALAAAAHGALVAFRDTGTPDFSVDEAALVVLLSADPERIEATTRGRKQQPGLHVSVSTRRASPRSPTHDSAPPGGSLPFDVELVPLLR